MSRTFHAVLQVCDPDIPPSFKARAVDGLHQSFTVGIFLLSTRPRGFHVEQQFFTLTGSCGSLSVDYCLVVFCSFFLNQKQCLVFSSLGLAPLARREGCSLAGLGLEFPASPCTLVLGALRCLKDVCMWTGPAPFG